MSKIVAASFVFASKAIHTLYCYQFRSVYQLSVEFRSVDIGVARFDLKWEELPLECLMHSCCKTSCHVWKVKEIIDKQRKKLSSYMECFVRRTCVISCPVRTLSSISYSISDSSLQWSFRNQKDQSLSVHNFQINVDKPKNVIFTKEIVSEIEAVYTL